MKTAVMTDTNSGIMKAEADSMGIFLIPMPVIINQKDVVRRQSLSMMRHTMKESILPKLLSMKA